MDVAGERRKQLREGSVRWLEAQPLAGDQGPWRISCLDLSLDGCRISLPVELPPGSLLRLSDTDRLWLVEVVWCRLQNGGLEAGCRIEHAIHDLGLLRAALRARNWYGQESEVTPKVT